MFARNHLLLHTSPRRTPAMSSRDPRALGDALRIVFRADAKALASLERDVSASKNDELVRALAILLEWCHDDVDTVLDPLLERASSSTRYARFVALLAHRAPKSVRDALRRALGVGGTKALAACACARASAEMERGTGSRRQDDGELLEQLRLIVLAGEGRSPTRLASAAVDAFAAMSSLAAEDRDEDLGGFEAREDVVGVVTSWARLDGKSELFIECCDGARARLRSLARDGDDSSRRARARLLNQAWIDWAPALASIRGKKWEREMLVALESAFAATCEMLNMDEPGAGEGVAHALITVGLHLGRTGIDHENRAVFSAMVCEETAKALDEMLHQYTGTAILPALRCSNPLAQTVASVLIRVILAPEHMGWTEQTETLLRGVLPLVEEGSDIISVGFARLVADLIIRDPNDESLLQILRICGGSATNAKMSALRVLTEFLRRDQSTMLDSTANAIVRSMLPRLADKNLEVRKAAAGAFAHIAPPKVLPALFELLISDDVEERSASGDAILATMREQKPTSRALKSYLDALSAASSSDSPDAEKRVSHAVKLLARFAESLHEIELRDVAETLTTEVFSSPSSSSLNQAVVVLAPWIGKSIASEHVIEACAHQLSSQNANKGADENEIFDRLAPLLLLRVLPLAIWDRESRERTDIQKCLRYRMLNVQGEFEDVRRVCSEMFAKVPQQTLDKELLSELERAYRSARTDSDDLARVRTCMFCCSAGLAVRGKSALSESFVNVLRSVCVNILAWSACDTDGDDFFKAQMGAMETLASIIVAEVDSSARTQKNCMKKTSKTLLEPETSMISFEEIISATPSGRPLIVELDDDTKRERVPCAHETLHGVLHLACLTDRDIPTWVDDVPRTTGIRVALINVIITAARRPRRGATLVDECFSPLVACAERHGDPNIREAALQALMMLFHLSQDDIDESITVALTRSITNVLRDHTAGDTARKGAAKVATALLAASDRHISAIEPYLESLRQSLTVAARVAVDTEVASLANKLAMCMTQTAERL